MRKIKMFPLIFLQLLADGGDGSGDTGVTGQVAADTGVESQVAAENKAQESFADLIKGKYKSDFDKEVNTIVRARLKDSKDTIKAHSPIMDLLAAKYKLEANDSAGILKALQDDDALYEAAAAEQGMDIDTYKAMQRIELENKDLKRQVAERERQEGSNRLYAQWLEASKGVQAIYPQFNLQAELANPQFTELLGANIPMQTAYEVIHHSEILPAAMQFAAQKAEENISKTVSANRSRPRENGIHSQAGAQVTSDPSKLSFKEIDDIIRRVGRGERIDFSNR